MPKNFLIVGTICNVHSALAKDLYRVYAAFEPFGNVDIHLIESDSKDDTKELLARLALQFENFSFEFLGDLSDSIPNRIDRIRFCRNKYVSFIRENYLVKKWDFVVVADLDGMNSAIKSKSVGRVLKKMDLWDACFATQTLGYYDLYALRSTGWVTEDVFENLEELKRANPFEFSQSRSLIYFISAFLHFDKLRKKAIYSKMKRLRGDLVHVDSAFGGIGIYKTLIFLNYDYSRINGAENFKCEHLDLHSKCIQDRLQLAIDPIFINSHWNEYNLNKFCLLRLAKELKKFYFKS